MRWRWGVLLAIGVVVLALAAVGCGGDGDGGAVAETTTEETTAPEETTDDTVTEEEATETSGGGTFASDDCQKLVDLSKEYGEAIGAATSGGDTAGIAESAEAFQAFADEVPEVIREDFQVMADAFSRYAEVLADVDLTSGQPPDPDTLAKLQQLFTGEESEKVAAASQRITDWSNANCAP